MDAKTILASAAKKTAPRDLPIEKLTEVAVAAYRAEMAKMDQEARDRGELLTYTIESAAESAANLYINLVAHAAVMVAGGDTGEKLTFIEVMAAFNAVLRKQMIKSLIYEAMHPLPNIDEDRK